MTIKQRNCRQNLKRKLPQAKKSHTNTDIKSTQNTKQMRPEEKIITSDQGQNAIQKKERILKLQKGEKSHIKEPSS